MFDAPHVTGGLETTIFFLLELVWYLLLIQSFLLGAHAEHGQKRAHLYRYRDAPPQTQINPHVLYGYRGALSTQLCLESLFWWTNETINIWSHFIGFVVFIWAGIRDFVLLEKSGTEKFIVIFVLTSLKICMVCSTLYHTFMCRSPVLYRYLYFLDLGGVALAIYSMNLSFMYYVFWCSPVWLAVYLTTWTLIFVGILGMLAPRWALPQNTKFRALHVMAVFSFMPLLHGYERVAVHEDPCVQMVLGRAVTTLQMSAGAFFIFKSQWPERLAPGKFDYCGYSHQWWHVASFIMFYYWYQTGIVYFECRAENPGVC